MSLARERLEELASRLMDGSLSPAEERELGETLQSSREARELLRSYFRLEGTIADLARVDLLSRLGVADQSRRRAAGRTIPAAAPGVPPKAAWAIGAVAAAALVGLLYGALQTDGPGASRPTGPTARISRPEPEPERPAPTRPEAAPPAPDFRANPVLPRPSIPEGVVPPRLPDPPSVPSAPQGPALEPPAPGTPRERPEPKETQKSTETIVTQVTLERVEGDVTLTGAGRPKPARAGDSIASGQGLETGGGKSLAVLTFPDGSRLEAESDSSLRDIRLAPPQEARGGKSVFLHHGSVWAQIRPQPGDLPFVIGTPRGEARVPGSVLTIHVDADPKGAVRLDVQEGKVRFNRPADGRSVEVPPGHSVTSAQGSDLALLRSTEILVSFQDGAAPTSDYFGTRDTFISEKNPAANNGHAKVIAAEGEDGRSRHQAQWALLRWDLSSIPPGSRVRAASVNLHVTEPTRGGAFYFHEPARPWVETEATWRMAQTGNPWRLPGSLGGIERWGIPLGAMAPLVKGEYSAVLNEAGIALVQSWVNAPASNLGLLLASPDPGAGLHFSAREAPLPDTRPKLTVVVTPRR
jgi:hypothetical protein